jgi:OOP family OmpA-OmpF porin
MLRTPLFFTILSFIVAGVAAIAVAVVTAIAIERRSIEDVNALLMSEGFTWAEIDADGLQVFIQGTAPDEASRFLAESRAASVVDADRVVNNADIRVIDAAPVPRFSLDMLRNGDGIQIIGLVPGDNGGEDVAEAIESIADGAGVTDMVETADFPPPDTWISALGYGLRALRELPRSKVTVYADRVEVQAISESAEQRAELLADLQMGQPAGVEVVLDISAPRPVFSPFQFRAVLDAQGLRIDNCAADTSAAQERILNAARDGGALGTFDCPVGLGAPTARWSSAVQTGLSALAELGSGTLSISDTTVTLIAVQGAEQDEFDRVIGELDAALPEVFALNGVLPEATDAGAGPARFFATLDPETGVRLRGRLPTGAVGASVEAFAISLFGRDRTDLATRAVPELPQGWSVRAMAGLQALSALHEGRMTLEPEVLRIQGRTGDQTLRAQLTRQLSEELGADADFQLDVVYDESLDPIASLPSPEECVADIVAVQEDNKIVFEPGSVEITEEAGEILDRIAEILPDCLHVPMEIGGHTDSQGREEMNLGLSQSRADAVLNGILARGILVTNLTARGYGETRPIADNDTEEGRERNRRIEFLLQADVDARDAGEAAAEADTLRAEAFGRRPVPRPDDLGPPADDAGDQDEE